MICRWFLVLLLALAPLVSAGKTMAEPRFVFVGSLADPPDFRRQFRACLALYKAAGGLARGILRQLDGATVYIGYSNAASVTQNPQRPSKGLPVDIFWNSRDVGTYPWDRATKDRCATLLHELQHAARFFIGRECTGPKLPVNDKAYNHDEGLGVRAENWWLHRRALQGVRGIHQRTHYGPGQRVPRWTRWPLAAGTRVPRQPECHTFCFRFNQPGCFDFKGGIYSGGDHRRVASGSLRIEVGEEAYCQDREPCEFRSCVTCPHLDTAFPEGARVRATATPDAESRFARWGPGECQGQGATCTFIARKHSCISAQFLLLDPQAPPQSLPNVPCTADPR